MHRAIIAITAASLTVPEATWEQELISVSPSFFRTKLFDYFADQPGHAG